MGQHLLVMWAAVVSALVGISPAGPGPRQAQELYGFMAEWPAHCAPGEPEKERADRLLTIARGVGAVATRTPLGSSKNSPGGKAGTGPGKRTIRARAYALLVLTAGESGVWDPFIHAGLTHPDPTWHQDHGRARCLAQLHASKLLPRDEWLATAGTDQEATERCLGMALRLLEGHLARCGVGYTEEGLAIGYAGYARGNGCAPYSESRARAHRWAVAMKTGHAPQN